MGHHYLPQRYLKGFQAPATPGCIWMYDKQKETSKLLPIKQVGQMAEFYENDVEIALNVDVEQPGNDVIDKLRQGKSIDEMDRRHLSYYVGTMIRRVPHARGKAKKNVPQVLADVTRETRDWFQEAARAGHIDDETLAAKLAETDVVGAKFQKHTPGEVTKIIETPWPFASWLIAIYSMYWRVVRSEGPSYFLTNDNPVYTFEAYGLASPQCELIFPLCSDLLMHASWCEGEETGIQLAPQQLVKEFNRRTAVGAARFVFYHQEAAWVFRAAQNRVEQLNQIRW
jgi:Protein of unknown function (DUF4238)